jgi:hypothetical protein
MAIDAGDQQELMIVLTVHSHYQCWCSTEVYKVRVWHQCEAEAINGQTETLI